MAAPGQTFTPGSAAAPSSQVEISVSCRNLKDKDAFSKSDPMCVVSIWDIKTKMFHEFGRTEMVKDSLNPDFVKKFNMNYFFEESQKLKFEVYDVDSPSQKLSAHDFLGRLECTLGEIVGCGSGKMERKLIGIQGLQSKIYICVEEVSSSKEHIHIQMRATGLDKKDFLGKSDPFLIFYRANPDGTYTVVHKTEIIKNTLNPTWKPFMIPARTLCNGDHNRLIKVECYDWDSDGSHDLIGEFTTKLADLLKAPAANTIYEVVNPKKKAKKRNYKHSGELMVMTCKAETVHSFLDYLQGGVEMNFTVAIDFTASNGAPSQPTSLHYYSPHQSNQYAAAIQAVGEIIQDYDTDKLFPVLGFGAKMRDGSVSHEFPCNFNPANPYCAGIQGILQAYYTSLQQVQLYGPTNFSPVIKHVSRFAEAKQDGSTYFVLLIITDGVITDMEQTMREIIHASRLPMSIIIVGVGNAEFDAMDMLDADGRRLSFEGRSAERDIVQFVPFREFIGRQYGNDMVLSQAALAKAVLAEVPDQVLYYMKKSGYKPKPQRQVAPSDPASGAPYTGPGQQGQGQPGYPAGAPPGQADAAPYPQGQGQPPYQQGQGQYPQGPGGPQRGQATYPQGSGGPQGGQAPYPQGPGAPQRGQAPYPQGPGGPQVGQAPYPQGPGGPQGGQAPYPQGPGGSQGGQAPYPQGPGSPQAGQAPYPQGPGGPQGGQAPYPQGPGGSQGGQAPYPQGPGGPQGGQAPYPQGSGTPQGGQAPYPQGNTPYPTTQPGAPQRPPPTYQNARK